MIQKMLEVSTANMKQKEAFWISVQAVLTEQGKMDLIVYPKGEYGYFVPLYPDMLEGKIIPSESIVLLIGYAMGKGCSWIMIDRDIEPIDDLPTYDW